MDRELRALERRLSDVDESLERLCEILEDALPKPKPDGPGYVCVDGDFIHLGEITVEEIGDADTIVDSEGNEWKLISECEDTSECECGCNL